MVVVQRPGAAMRRAGCVVLDAVMQGTNIAFIA
jgi:hypothetical protein